VSTLSEVIECLDLVRFGSDQVDLGTNLVQRLARLVSSTCSTSLATRIAILCPQLV